MAISVIPVVKKNENKKAWFIPGHVRMSIASMDSSSSPVLVTVCHEAGA
jgi:hypothetical protein